MIARKIAEIMISQNGNEKNYRSSIILTRLKQIIMIVLKYSDSPAISLKELGICIDKNCIQVKLPLFCKILYLPSRIVLENMQKEGFVEKKSAESNTAEWRCFALPETPDGNSIITVLNSTKFLIESQFASTIKDRKEPVINRQSPALDNKKTSIKLPPKLSFSTQFQKPQILGQRETGYEYSYYDPFTSSPGAPTLPKIDRTANPNTVFIIDPASTWMSTLEVKAGQELFLPQLIQPQTNE